MKEENNSRFVTTSLDDFFLIGDDGKPMEGLFDPTNEIDSEPTENDDD